MLGVWRSCDLGISLSPETQKLIAVDADTEAALDRADAKIQRGQYRDLKDVAAELGAEYPRR